MPAGVPPPDECELEEVRVTRIANESGVTEKLKNVLLLFASVCRQFFKLKLLAVLILIYSNDISCLGAFAKPHKDKVGQGARRV
jgi:hypothetical protein